MNKYYLHASFGTRDSFDTIYVRSFFTFLNNTQIYCEK